MSPMHEEKKTLKRHQAMREGFECFYGGTVTGRHPSSPALQNTPMPPEVARRLCDRFLAAFFPGTPSARAQ
jgi:hypothetical protein